MKKLLLLFLICFMGVLNARTLPTTTETSFSVESKAEFFQQRKKTVSVKSYKRKNGTTVKAHKRSAPKRRH